MTTTQTQLETKLAELTQEAFSAFCNDISCMFDCSMETVDQKILRGPLNQLQKEFKRVVSINTIDATGILDGKFAIWFDQAAIFILSGIVVMLPEKRVRENAKMGGIKEAQELTDAIKELGNLMVGSWDRIFRENLPEHKHLKQGRVFIGQAWQNPAESIGLDMAAECLVVTTKIKVSDFDPVLCAVVYPAELLEPKAQIQPQPESAVKEAVPDIPAVQSEPESAAPKIETVAQPAQPSPVSKAIEQLIQPEAEKIKIDSFSACGGAGQFDLNQPVQSIANSHPVWIDPNDSIQKAIQLMQQHNTGYLLGGKDGHLEGILSRSDTAAAISPYTKSLFSNYRRPLDDATFQIRCKWFLSRPVRAITSETPVWMAIGLMCKYAVRSLVILNAQNNVTGLITAFDILQKFVSIDSALTGTINQAPPFLMDTKTE